MSAKILNGKEVANIVTRNIKREVDILIDKYGVAPTLATVLVGQDPASMVYVSRKVKTCSRLSMNSVHLQLPEETSVDDVIKTIEQLNNDESVHGILMQLPLPKRFPTAKLLELINPEKDVDGFHPFNLGRLISDRETFTPCTPSGIMKLLDYYNISLEGKNAVVIGRSVIVGKPLGILLLRKNATVTYCHSRTKNLREICKRADIVVTAIGKAGIITGDFVREGAVVIDVGINKISDEMELKKIAGDEPKHWESFEKKGYALVGDIEWKSVFPKISAITPVPGGVGPLTIAMLMYNTLKAFKSSIGER